MNCEAAQRILSARMDGERVPVRHAETAVHHAETCARCRAFADRSARIRSGVRIRAAEPVPDLVEPIMAAVARERTRPTRLGLIDRRIVRPRRARHRRPFTLAPAVAAAIAGMVLGSVLVGGPWQGATNRPIAAATVVRSVRIVAPTLDSFRGTYVIHEFGLSPDVPERVLDMEVAFRSPQRFLLEVRDRTTYPSPSWTPTDLRFIQDLTTTFTSGPSGCPGDLPADVCPRTRAAVTHVAEFSAAAPLPADLVLPVATFGSPTGFRVLGEDRLGSREAIRVRLSFERAAPLFPFLRIGGTWRPFFDRDPVLLWLDAHSLRPLRMVVRPSSSPERREWEFRYGQPEEAPDRPILDVRLVSVSEEEPSLELFRIPGGEPIDPPTLEELPGRIGYLPATPGDPGDLELVSIVVPTPSAPATPSSVLVYAEGLDYLKVGEQRDWDGPEPFGPLDPGAQEIPLAGGGVAYYEPAGEGFGRRLAIHTASADLFLETNLPRERLLEIASSLPLEGRPLPAAWRDRGSLGVDVEAIDVAAGLAAAGLPASLIEGLPGGYVVASAERSTVGSALEGITFRLRQVDTDATGEPLTLHVEPEASLPPPSSSEQSTISFSGLEARWTPGRAELEWVDHGVYHSLQGDLEIRSVIEIARAIATIEAEADR